jgi:CDP-paratose 2-epimerase
VTASAARRVLITGGAGFVGGNLAIALAERHPDWDLVAFDNLHRRGSELNLPRLREHGIDFVHGDVRDPGDLMAIQGLNAIVECSAEPSAQAGRAGDASYLVGTNLTGAHNCLELARRDDAQVVFLSTSRVYPYRALDALSHHEDDTRFVLDDGQATRGATAAGVSEEFPLNGPRTLYGATKLAAELLIADYAAAFGLRSVIDRCGVIAGPWQMGKVDQGVFTFWALAHYFHRDLSYIGYGGNGKQVRDLLHVDDLAVLIDDQLSRPEHWDGLTVNVGGGRDFSLSLIETTRLCREITGHRVEVASSDQDRLGDVRIYLSDCALLESHTDWRPERDPRQVLEETIDWLRDNERIVKAALG